ncbi:MAG: AAA family ATPase, partial [Acidobacteria bacterium]|nr:AAA family ATPase [Acidobacteriota bacterium]
MIRFLSVRNLAVVEHLDLELQPGFTVLTGETGAGKSIVLGALGLLAGARATADLVRTGTPKAVVQAALETGAGEEIVFRREVTAQGRSRAFVNDALTAVGGLQAIGREVLDFHGQHQHQALLDPHNHLPLLDAHGKREGRAGEVAPALPARRGAGGARGG